MNLVAIPAFTDNYIWMLHDGTQAVVVDPGEAGPVEAELDRLNLALVGILVTHHHADHTGGNADVRAATGARLLADPRAAARVGPIDQALADRDIVMVGDVRLTVLAAPGHTPAHVVVYAASAAAL